MPIISRLNVGGFRGVPVSGASLIFDKKCLLLFGENGTGKSSFVDAIEKLLCGRVATLDGRAQGISSDRQGVHIRAGTSGPSISLVFSNPDFTYRLGDARPSMPNGLAKYMLAAEEDLFILRRKDILTFIESQPRDRYARLRPFLPLLGIQEVENAMREARDAADRSAGIARDRVAQRADSISKTLGIVGEPTKPSLVAAISKILADLGYRWSASLEEASAVLDLLDQELAKFGDTTLAGRLLNAAGALRELLDITSPDALSQFAEACRKLREKEAAESRVFYDRVLEDGIKWIREENRAACPLCDNPIDPAATIAKAQARLDSMRELISLRNQASSGLTRALASVRAIMDSLTKARKSLSATGLPDDVIQPESLAELSGTLAALDLELQKGLRNLDLEALARSTGALRPESPEKASMAGIAERVQKALAALPSTDRAKQLLSAQQRIYAAVEGWSQLDALKAVSKAADAEAAQAKTVYERALESRREVVQELYDRLSSEIDGIYTGLHPDESHGHIRLEVREVGQGSANLRGSFYEKTDEDPRGYYSDAHLDTLGISIFLALRRWHRKRYPDFNLLVLDDVLTSMDNAHAVRLSKLLLKEFGEYQVLLTTHDRIWFEHFQDIQTRCGVSANYVNKVIHKWTIEEGPDLREPEDEQDRLKQLLADGTSEDIAAMAGRLLEHILQEMRYSLSLSVQAKRSERYEIGELWPPFYKAIRKNYRNLYSQTQSTLDSLDFNWPVRNWVGAHFNEWAKHTSRQDSVRFGAAVVGLFEAVFCPDCRKFITPSITPIGQLSCRCGALIYPAPGKSPGVVVDRNKLVEESDAIFRDSVFDTDAYFERKHADLSREQ